MNEDNLKNEPNVSDRVSFIIGLFAAILALYPFKEVAQNTTIGFFNWNISIYTLAGFFLTLLFLSAYFYGLNSIRYGLDKLIKLRWLKFIETLASFLYFLAFIFPILIFLLWVVSIFFNFFILNFKQSQELIFLFSNFISVLLGLLTFFTANYIFRQKEKQLSEELDKMKKYYNDQFQKNSKGADYKLIILSLFQTLMTTLELVLTKEIGSGIKRMSTSRIIKIAQERGLITQQELNAILDLVVIRNQIAHNLDSFSTSESQIKYLENIILQTIKRIEKV